MCTSYPLPMGLSRGIFQPHGMTKKINASRVAELRPQINTTFSDIRRDNYVSTCFVLGKTYLKVFEGMQNWVPTHTGPIVVYGPMGKKQTQLKKWLWRERQ